ncbi:30S ribosome-binding factor RbfA [Actinotignum urinale]|uniref:30S ribosome-binding factor RbfA n=1 Tax=Actinotignum urinale TaxID=190146 RepID=UPI0003B56E19|nr:30S ribosome-binding factor RbfA [Actinotignum urinale]MDY5160763.1 30S ribosome-binding factor RbfA [Actinotignum urinale]
MSNTRADRVAKRIQQVVAQMINLELKDPRLNMATITDVRVTGDLQNATIYFTAIGHEHQIKDAQRGLNAAKGKIRSRVGQELGLRLTPTLEFEPDHLMESALEFENLLAATKKRDEELAAQRGTEYAGGEDPYKTKDEDRADSPNEKEQE